MAISKSTSQVKNTYIYLPSLYSKILLISFLNELKDPEGNHIPVKVTNNQNSWKADFNPTEIGK